MYYNRILRAIVFDQLDYFLISCIIGSLIASRFKDYSSEEKSMERLKNSLIQKSKLSKSVIKSERTIFNSKETRIRKIYRIYRLALSYRGGELEDFLLDHQVSNETFKLALTIKEVVHRLAHFLKQQEIRGVARLFFKNSRLILELILCHSNIDISYVLLNEGLNTQVIVMTATVGGAVGFTLSWFAAGLRLILPPVLISMVLIRSVAQQIVNQRDYSKFKNMVNKMLADDKLKQTITAFFTDEKIPTRTPSIEMKPLDLDKNSLPEFNVKSDQTFEEFIKDRMKEELGLIENPTQEQLEDIIYHRQINNKPRSKTVYLRDIIDDVAGGPDNILDAEIVNEPIRVKIKNE